MTTITGETNAVRVTTDAVALTRRLSVAGPQSMNASIQFKRLLENDAATAPNIGERECGIGTALELGLRRFSARSELLSNQNDSKSNADTPSFPTGESFLKRTGMPSEKDPVATDSNSSGYTGSSPSRSDLLQAVQHKAVETVRTNTTPDRIGELAQMLYEHCQGVYVGIGSANGNANRVMLRLAGAMSGVSVEIINAGAALHIKMHVSDHDKWDAIQARKGELEQALSALSESSVRVEPVLSGAQT